MAKKLFEVPPVKNAPCKEVLAVLKHLTEKAEAGEINGVAFIASYAGSVEETRGTFSNGFVGNPDRDILGFLGSLDILKERIRHHAYIPERDD